MSERIETTIVKQAVTVERLAEDMELEPVQLFPKQNDLRLQSGDVREPTRSLACATRCRIRNRRGRTDPGDGWPSQSALE